MPASILTLLISGSCLLHSGASADPRAGGSSSVAWCCVIANGLEHQPTIEALPLDPASSWGRTDATSEEEESNDGEGYGIVASRIWSLSRLALPGQTSMVPLSRGRFISAIRCTILRC